MRRMKKLTKLDTAQNPRVESAQTVEEYGESIWQSLFKNTQFDSGHLSPSVGYSVVGEILREAVVGDSLRMMRYSRNGEVTPGVFQTSEITEVDGDYFTTMNSLYKVEDYIE